MMRKRFVKLLMAQEYSRNEANAAAREAVMRGNSYGAFGKMILSIVEAINAATPQLIAAMNRLQQEAEAATE